MVRVPWFTCPKGLCLNTNGRNTCTRQIGHTGRHHAASIMGRLLAVWW